MNKFILVMLAAISAQSLAGEFKIGLYAEKLNKVDGSHAEQVQQYYDGYPVTDNNYYTVEGGHHLLVGPEYYCCADVPYNNDLEYISVGYSDYGYSVNVATYNDAYNERVYSVSAHKVIKSERSVSFGLGVTVDDSMSVSPSLVLSYEEYFAVPSLEINKDNVSAVLSVRF